MSDNGTVSVTFRLPVEIARIITELRGDVSQSAVMLNACEYMASIKQLISVDKPPVQGEIDQSELAVLKRDIESLKAAIKTDKTKFDKFNKAELADDPYYIELYDFYGQDFRAFSNLEHNDLINLGRTIFSNDLTTARKFADAVAARQKKIDMYEGEHQFKTMKANILIAMGKITPSKTDTAA